MVKMTWRPTTGPSNTSTSISWHVITCHMAGDDGQWHGELPLVSHKQYEHIRKLTHEPMCACHMACDDDDADMRGATIGPEQYKHLRKLTDEPHGEYNCRHISESWHVSHMAGDDANDMESYHWFWAITSIAPKAGMRATWDTICTACLPHRQAMALMTWRATISGSWHVWATWDNCCLLPHGVLTRLMTWRAAIGPKQHDSTPEKNRVPFFLSGHIKTLKTQEISP